MSVIYDHMNLSIMPLFADFWPAVQRGVNSYDNDLRCDEGYGWTNNGTITIIYSVSILLSTCVNSVNRPACLSDVGF